MSADGGSGGGGAAAGRPPRVLMVCLGNICRSPAAEAVLRAAAAHRALPLVVDSCGTGGGSPEWYAAGGFSHHEGDAGDPRMRAAAAARGLDITSRSRPLVPADLEGAGAFDVIVGMDGDNLRAMETARRAWVREGRCAGGEVRWRLLSEFSKDEAFRGQPVPDPYYGGRRGFEHALDLIEGAADGILDELYGEGARGTEGG
jgi:protein-tyrosine phosphatase